MGAWEDLKGMVSVCDKCELSRTRTNTVFGEGNPDAEIMFVGEAPGKDEDAKGRPFVGAAGKLLDKMIEGIGLARADVFIGNIIKCRPPENRDPRPEEIEACKDFLFAQISFISPKVICTLGRHSLHTLVQPDLPISRVHGKPMKWKGILCLPMYHPAAALYRRSQLDDLKFDFDQLKALMDNGFYM
ncbi:MAG: Uracil DNA glycosylase superfamily protein [bacterium ADurb.Bin236]|nr:MAG: Uracil DNA glycosylase superfamily protein [bacterium ADurb.Bin236]HPN95031.1 uracil-DNA glycosylase [bacterium]